MGNEPEPPIKGELAPTRVDRPRDQDRSREDLAPTRPSNPQPAGEQVPAAGTGRYRTGREIARGGMGRVVEATDRVLGREVAIKEALTTDVDTLRRFARETWITARLEHPAIVPVYDAGTNADGSPYYVMRKVSGKPLGELVEAAVALGDRLALIPHIVAVAQAVAHAENR